MNARETYLAERFWARLTCTCGSSVTFDAKDQATLDEWMESFLRGHDHADHEVTKVVKAPLLAPTTSLEVKSPVTTRPA